MMNERSPSNTSVPWRWPSFRLRDAVVLLVVFTTVGFVQGTTVGLAGAERGAPNAVASLVGHLTGAFAAWIALPVVQAAVINAFGGTVRWTRIAAVHAGGYVLFALVHISVMMTTRVALARALTLPTPTLPVRFQVLWEAQSDLVLYAGLAALLTLLHAWGARRAAELRAAKLEMQLTSARLDALTAQLDPHFLFNALNTLSAVMYEDVERADRLIAGLGDILRATLGAGSATWTLAAERSHTERYVELLEARFGDRLGITCEFEEGLDDVRVPRFALQALVENAVKHNQSRDLPLAVRVSAGRIREGTVSLVVEDDGDGFDISPTGARRGLSRLSETLRLLHGNDAGLHATRSSSGGARVAVTFPERTSDGEERPPGAGVGDPVLRDDRSSLVTPR